MKLTHSFRAEQYHKYISRRIINEIHINIFPRRCFVDLDFLERLIACLYFHPFDCSQDCSLRVCSFQETRNTHSLTSMIEKCLIFSHFFPLSFCDILIWQNQSIKPSIFVCLLKLFSCLVNIFIGRCCCFQRRPHGGCYCCCSDSTDGYHRSTVYG